jgi:hypothetical protein
MPKEKKLEKDRKGKAHRKEPLAEEPAVTLAAAEARGISSTELTLVFPDEPASCSFEPSSGRLTLKIPQPLDGQEGPQGPPGVPGPGLDLSRAPGAPGAFFLFVDEAGRLAYSAQGKVSYVSLSPCPAGEASLEGPEPS